MDDYILRLKNFLFNLNIYPHNLDLYVLAFTHKSRGPKNNEKLEFLGDSVLELVVSHKLFVDFGEIKSEGELTSLRAALVKTESLAEEATKIGLNNFLILSNSEEYTGGRQKVVILADTFEAFIGAIYLDQGFDTVRNFIIDKLYYKINHVIKYKLDIDPKTKLQEIIQDKYKITPHYRLVSTTGPDHNKLFKVVAVIGEKEFGIGKGKSKQLAEQDAALKTIEILEKNNWII